MARVIVIGGGAAGLAAAIEAAGQGDETVLLERMERVGKKLLATGNGRCNLMNTGAWRYPGGGDYAAETLSRCGAEEQRRFWEGLGLRLRQEADGRVYPASGQASTVLDVLRLAMERRRVTVHTGATVEELRPCRGGFAVKTGDRRLTAERVILAGGGCAQPKLGSDGSCYGLLKALGHTVTAPTPCLTPILTETGPLRGLAGIRVKCQVQAEDGGRVLHRESGEALFTDYGLSGVCVMQCARWAREGGSLTLNLLPALGLPDGEALRETLLVRRREWREQPLEQLLTGLCVPRLAAGLCAAAGITWKNRVVASMTDKECSALVGTVSGWRLRVRGVKGFDAAQVTMGGARPGEFNPASGESRLIPGLHAAGEVLDVDGDCGGFNLMFAFGSGILAGRNGR